MKDEEIIKIILDEAFYIHKIIGPGMLENVYKTCLAYRLRKRSLYVETEKPVPLKKSKWIAVTGLTLLLKELSL